MSHELPPDLYLRGIALFNRGEYFEAHEAWEHLWHDAQGTDRVFYQALIQATVTLEHCRRGNLRGASNLWRACHAKLFALPGRFMGMDLPAFTADMERALGPVLAPGGTGSPLDPSLAPTILIDFP